MVLEILEYYQSTKQLISGSGPHMSGLILVQIVSKGYQQTMGAQWLSGRVLDSRPKGSGFEPHRCHCVVVLEQDTFILA